MHLLPVPFLLLTLASSALSLRQSAALIVGGYDAKTASPEGPTIRSVELFGCEGGPIQVADFPGGIYLSGGLRLQDPENHQVLVCGGYECQGTFCGISNRCLTWGPASNAWSSDFSDLKQSRWSFIMGLAPNISQTGDSTERPMVFGYSGVTEMFNEADNAWEEYLKSDPNWYGLGCLFQDTEGNHEIYNVRDKVQRLDVQTWSITDLGDVPQALVNPRMCSPVTINGHRGIFTKFGAFFNLVTRQWEKKAFPPNDPFAASVNAMFNFRGRPTIFGQPRCNAIGECSNIEVIQYVPGKDKWISLGDMTRPRTYITMVEVPAEYCDYFVPPKKN